MRKLHLPRRSFLTLAAGAALSPLASPAVFGQAAGAPEKAKIVLGVGGRSLLYYLPLTIAERRGFFREEGLEVEVNDFGGGARSLQALVGGSVEVVAGAYEHTVRMQARGQDIRAVVELLRFPCIVLAAHKDRPNIKSAADLKGAKIGVTAPGSSTFITAQFAMLKAGLKPADASFIGVGGAAAAIAAVKRGEIDAISHLDPVIARLEAEGDIRVLVDTRTEAGTRALFGGTNPAACIYARKDFIDRHPNVMQRVVNAHLKALKWIVAAKPDDIAAAVPPEYLAGDRAIYEKSAANTLEAYSRTGVPAPEGMRSVFEMLKSLDPEMANANVDLASTFDGRFVERARIG